MVGPSANGSEKGTPSSISVPAGELQQLLDRLQVMPVLTAHPTEAKRRTVMVKLARIAGRLHELDTVALTPDEWRDSIDLIAEEIASLWQTDETRTRQPSVLDEVRNSLYYVENTLFELAPRLHVEMRRALADAYPGVEFSLPPFLRIGSWVGGDRDGNPFVTLAVTEETLRTQKALALRLYRGVIDGMYGVLSASQRLPACPMSCGSAWPRMPRSFPPKRSALPNAILASPTARRWRSSTRSCWPRKGAAGLGAPTGCRIPQNIAQPISFWQTCA